MVGLSESSKDFEHTIAIVVIVKNEGPYICEWIQHHINIGITKIYLYDNDSSDDTVINIKPFVENGMVEYIWFPGKCVQLNAYFDAIVNFRNECRYMAIVDADEFIIPCDKSKTLITVVDDILSLDPLASGIAVNWRMYGPSGHITKPVGGVLENYLYRVPDDHSYNISTKTIFNPRDVYSFINPHYPAYLEGKYCINEKGERLDTHYNEANYPLEKIRINHYFCKSKEEWIKRRSIGKADLDETRSFDEFLEFHYKSVIYDDIGLYYSSLISGSGK